MGMHNEQLDHQGHNLAFRWESEIAAQSRAVEQQPEPGYL
jgi:hypothetical protein